MTKSNRGLAVVIMAVILFATIFMIPVPAASASTAGNAAVNVSAAAMKPNAAGRYILSGTVVQEPVIECEDLDGNNIQLLYCMIEDCNGEVWGYAYEMDNLDDVPPVNQSVILIMNCNGTPDDNFDDIIEDILWCNCAAKED